MTVQSTTYKSGPYAGAGITGPFTVGFRFLDASHLKVIKTSAAGLDTVLTLTTDYTVSGAGNTTGSLTLTSALAIGEKLTIIRDVPFTQLADYVNNDAFPAESHEDALDKLTMALQQLKERVDAALTLPATVSGVATQLPTPSSNKFIGWNEAATALQNIDPITLATIVAFGTARADIFTGDGVTTQFTLTSNPGAQANLDVSMGGVTQYPATDYIWAGGTTLTFTSPPPAGVKILARYFQGLPQGTADAAATVWVDNGGMTRDVQSTLQRLSLDSLSVKDPRFGAKGNGTADDTAAIQAAINFFSSGRGVVYFPPGTYKVTGPITVAKDRIHLIGAGSWATMILFAPTANGSCLVLSAGASVLFQGSVRGLAFFSNDATYTKNAIEMVDTSGYLLDDIVVGGSVVALPGSTFWSGGTGSRGIWNRGREACKQSRLYIYADIPVQISANPNNSISCDHFHFEDTYLAAANNPCMVIDSGVNVTNLTVDGYNPWVLGTDGLYWVDTTTSGVSQSVNLKNIRWEQGKNASSWCIRIEHNTNLQELLIENCQGGFERNGYKLRKCVGVTITNNINTGGAGRTVLDVDATVLGLTLNECLWQVNSTANIVGQHVVWSVPKAATGHPLPPSARYQSTTTSTNVGRQLETEMAQGGYQLTLANAAVANLGPLTMAGVLTVVDNEGISAQFLMRGSNTTTNEIFDPVGVFSPTAGTASSTNIYWSAGNNRYEIQNLRGGSRNYKIIFVGTYTSF